MLDRSYLEDYYKRFSLCWGYLRSVRQKDYDTIHEICKKRGYELERMQRILLEAEFIRIPSETVDLERLIGYGEDLGVVNKSCKFILEGRYIFPVKDMMGNVIALIGWYPDEKKYITTPSRLFSKECLFYGLEQLGKTGRNKPYIITEGIFDSLSARAVGLNCVAMMGISSSRYKEVVYSLFSRIVAVPDNDEQGRDVLINDKWKIPRMGRYFRWSSRGYYLKDLDDFCKSFEAEDVRDTLCQVFKEPERIVTLKL